MDRLSAASPLAGNAPLETTGLRVTAEPAQSLSELRGSVAFRNDPAHALLPSRHGRMAMHGQWRAQWLRPDGWLLIEAEGSQQAAIAFAAAARDGLCRTVDLSHGLCGIQLRGQAARELLSRGCPLDLRPQAFPVDHATRTRCADFTVILAHQPDGFDLHVDASLAQALWNWIADAAQGLGA